jgi:AcrR family transcriptional regulator
VENVYKRKKEPEFNKQAILDAAAEIGATQDWHHVTFQAIADKTGLSKGGIIHHFRSKEELLDELIRQSLEELTQWMAHEKKTSAVENSSIAYLRFVIGKSKDEKYRRTMKVIMQATSINEQYRKMWDTWIAANITKNMAAETDVNRLIVLLVADGLWFADNLGSYGISDKTKHKILNRLLKL